MARSGQKRGAAAAQIRRPVLVTGELVAGSERAGIATLEAAFGLSADLRRTADGLVASLAGNEFLVLDGSTVQALA